MKPQKKSDKNNLLAKLVLVTAVLNLIKSLVDIVEKLID